MSDDAAHALTRHLYEQVTAGRREILEMLLHDDFRLVGIREPRDRNGWLHLMLSESRFDSIAVQPLDAFRSPGVAVVTSAVTYTGTLQGEPIEGPWFVVDVWLQRGQDWRLISRTTFPAPAG